jgi:hypothetical protein
MTRSAKSTDHQPSKTRHFSDRLHGAGSPSLSAGIGGPDTGWDE